jgi:uncharacterized phage-associated protein
MASVLDTAQYILSQRGAMSAMKLQKLVYYSQAWSTVWDDDVLFPQVICAWKNGPVAPALWEAHRGQFRVTGIAGGNPANLPKHQKETIDRVLEFYGDKDAQWLSDLTHMEEPWKNAWAEGQNTEISPESLSEYYSSIEPPSAE